MKQQQNSTSGIGSWSWCFWSVAASHAYCYSLMCCHLSTQRAPQLHVHQFTCRLGRAVSTSRWWAVVLSWLSHSSVSCVSCSNSAMAAPCSTAPARCSTLGGSRSPTRTNSRCECCSASLCRSRWVKAVRWPSCSVKRVLLPPDFPFPSCHFFPALSVQTAA